MKTTPTASDTPTITDLRRHLFAALNGLTNKDAPMEIDRARAVADIAQTIINSAKVEIEHMKVSGGSGSRFLGSEEPPALPDGVVYQAPGVTVRQNKLRG